MALVRTDQPGMRPEGWGEGAVEVGKEVVVLKVVLEGVGAVHEVRGKTVGKTAGKTLLVVKELMEQVAVEVGRGGGKRLTCRSRRRKASSCPGWLPRTRRPLR